MLAFICAPNYICLRHLLTGQCLASRYEQEASKFDLCASKSMNLKETFMPIIAWLLGIPITVILLLMLFGVF